MPGGHDGREASLLPPTLPTPSAALTGPGACKSAGAVPMAAEPAPGFSTTNRSGCTLGSWAGTQVEVVMTTGKADRKPQSATWEATCSALGSWSASQLKAIGWTERDRGASLCSPCLVWPRCTATSTRRTTLFALASMVEVEGADPPPRGVPVPCLPQLPCSADAD
jgi:hypothetical protein